MASSQSCRGEFSRRTLENTQAQSSRGRREELRGFFKFAAEKQVQQLISRPFAFSYLEPDLTYSMCVNEFGRFIKYIEKCEQPDEKKQLSALIFPVFVHLYLFLLRKSLNAQFPHHDARAFFDVYHRLFLLKSTGYENVLSELMKFETPSQSKEHHYFSKFWKSKYMIKASVRTLQNLRTYLEDQKSQALVFVLHFFFHFEDEDSFSFIDEESKAESAENDLQVILTNVDLEENSPSSVSPVYVRYNLPYFCSADFNDKGSEICIASHNSSIENGNSFIHVERPYDSSSDIKQIRLPGVTAVKYVPGQSNIVLASYGINVKLVDTTTGEDKFKYSTEHVDRIWSVDANATLFATASRDLKTLLWKLDDPVAVREFIRHQDDVTAVKFHPNGLYFATGSADATVLLWDIEKSIPIRLFQHYAKITSLAFSADGRTLASSDSIGGVKLWDITKGCEGLKVPVARAQVSNLCFNDVSTHFAFCDGLGNFSRYDYRNCNELEYRDFKKTPVAMKFNKGDNFSRRREWKIAFLNQIL